MSKFKLISNNTSSIIEEAELVSKIEFEVDQQLIITRSALIKSKLRIEKAKMERVRKGLKTNKITAEELQSILEDWLDADRKLLSKSVRKLYNYSVDKEFKEKDWVKSILSSLYFGNNLLSAFNMSVHPKILILKNSKRFSKDKLTCKLTLSKRIINMSSDLDYEEFILEQQDQLLEKDKIIEDLLTKASWQTKATNLLNSGKKIKEVAIALDKSESTIKKFSASLSKGVLPNENRS